MAEDELTKLPFCKCGCNKRVARKGNVWIKGHHRRGVKASFESKLKMAESQIRRFSDPDERDAQSRRISEYANVHPEKGGEHSKFMIEHLSDPEVRKAMSEAAVERCADPEWRRVQSDKLKQFYIDNPEVLIAMSKRGVEFYSNQANRDIQSVMRIQYFIDNPEARINQSIKIKQYHIDHPEYGRYISERQIARFMNNPEARERASAISQGQDYDTGEWTGYSDKSRQYIVPIASCIQLNDRFEGSHGHHITKSIVAFMPGELHKHVKHNLRTGYNMGEMNVLALQFINGCYDG